MTSLDSGGGLWELLHLIQWNEYVYPEYYSTCGHVITDGDMFNINRHRLQECKLLHCTTSELRAVKCRILRL